MAEYSVIADTSKYLLDLLRTTLSPDYVNSPQAIALESPFSEKNDTMLQLYLYSICDSAEFVPVVPPSSERGMIANPPLVISLRYIIFFNQHAQMPSDQIMEHRIFGKIFQILYTNPVIPIKEVHVGADSNDEDASIRFSKLDDHCKYNIWSAISQPLRPAVYFSVEPLLLSGDSQLIPRVREVEGVVQKK